MKRNWKLIYLVAGIEFAFEALAGVRRLWMLQSDVGLSSLTIPILLFRILVFALLSIWALRQKKRGRLLNVLGLAYFAIALVNFWSTCDALGAECFRISVYNGTHCSFFAWIWSVTAFVLTLIGQPQEKQENAA